MGPSQPCENALFARMTAQVHVDHADVIHLLLKSSEKNEVCHACEIVESMPTATAMAFLPTIRAIDSEGKVPGGHHARETVSNLRIELERRSAKSASM